MYRLEQAIGWAISEENDFCAGLELVGAACGSSLEFFRRCVVLDADGSKRKYVQLTGYWADQVFREICTE